MRLEHHEYIKRVTEEFKRKRRERGFSPLLAHSSPANIRDECLNVYKERYHKKDDGILRAFFGPEEDGKKYPQIIRRFETSKFKPLDNYLKERTKETDDRNINLLAWLIDFQPRPYSYGMDDSEVPGENPFSGEEHDIERNQPEVNSKGQCEEIIYGQAPAASNRNKGRQLTTSMLVAASLLGLTGLLWIWESSGQHFSGNGNTGCMYWTGTDYAEIPCNDPDKNKLKLALDPERLKNFKRITREDTITEKSIGRIYYIRINGGIEYYTSGGHHPVYLTRTLHELSTYMYEKHLKKDSIPNIKNP